MEVLAPPINSVIILQWAHFHEPRRPHGKAIHTLVHAEYSYFIHDSYTPYSTPYSGSYGYSAPSLHTSTVQSTQWSWSSSFQCTLLYCPVLYGVLTVQCIWPHNDRYTIGLGLGLFVPASLPANGTLDPSTMPSIGFPRCGFQGCLA